MGVRFRKSVKLGKGVKLNLNSKSVSVTTGGKGFHHTVSSSGKSTTSASIPGTGLSYRTVSGGKSSASHSTGSTSSASFTGEPGGNPSNDQKKPHNVLKWVFCVLFLLLGLTRGITPALIFFVIAAVLCCPILQAKVPLKKAVWIPAVIIALLIGVALSPNSGSSDSAKEDPTVETVTAQPQESEPVETVEETAPIESETPEISSPAVQESIAPESEPAQSQQPETTAATVQEEQPEPSESEEIIVYVTETGAKYHRENCRTLKDSKIEITLEDAKRSYEPCGICNPPQ